MVDDQDLRPLIDQYLHELESSGVILDSSATIKTYKADNMLSIDICVQPVMPVDIVYVDLVISQPEPTPWDELYSDFINKGMYRARGRNE